MGHSQEDDASRSDYLSYLLRLWLESEKALEHRETPLWRASLTNPRTGERVGFANLEGLVAYLEERMGDPPGSGKIRDPSGTSLEDRGWSLRT